MSTPPAPSEGEQTLFRINSTGFRKEPRYKCPLACVGRAAAVAGEAPKEMIWLANLSRKGLAFVSSLPLEVGKAMAVTVAPLTRELTVQVVHATRQANGDWLVGCRFEGEGLSADEVEACLTREG